MFRSRILSLKSLLPKHAAVGRLWYPAAMLIALHAETDIRFRFLTLPALFAGYLVTEPLNLSKRFRWILILGLFANGAFNAFGASLWQTPLAFLGFNV